MALDLMVRIVTGHALHFTETARGGDRLLDRLRPVHHGSSFPTVVDDTGPIRQGQRAEPAGGRLSDASMQTILRRDKTRLSSFRS